jgi:hypothetical protein
MMARYDYTYASGSSSCLLITSSYSRTRGAGVTTGVGAASALPATPRFPPPMHTTANATAVNERERIAIDFERVNKTKMKNCLKDFEVDLAMLRQGHCKSWHFTLHRTVAHSSSYPIVLPMSLAEIAMGNISQPPSEQRLFQETVC